MTCGLKELVRIFHGFRNGIHVELFMAWDIADVFNVRMLTEFYVSYAGI